MTVYAAGLAAGAAAGADAGTKGLDFFKQLNEAGNFVPVDAEPAKIAQGTDADRRSTGTTTTSRRATSFDGNPPLEIVVPKTGVVAGVYVQAISAYAPHPNAAKLWMEHLYSDEGQLLWLKGYCHPIRFNDLAKNGKIPQELLDKLPPAAAYEAAVFPSLDEQTAAKGVDRRAMGHGRRRQREQVRRQSLFRLRRRRRDAANHGGAGRRGPRRSPSRATSGRHSLAGRRSMTDLAQTRAAPLAVPQARRAEAGRGLGSASCRFSLSRCSS